MFLRYEKLKIIPYLLMFMHMVFWLGLLYLIPVSLSFLVSGLCMYCHNLIVHFLVVISCWQSQISVLYIAVVILTDYPLIEVNSF
jgi:hypothetical protein